jgi:hypothetical protein
MDTEIRSPSTIASRTGSARAAGASGIVSVVLVVASRLVAGSVPQVTASSHALLSYYAKRSHWHRQEAGLLLGALSMVFFLWFLGGLRSHLRVPARPAVNLSSVMLAAGAVFAVLVRGAQHDAWRHSVRAGRLTRVPVGGS